MTVRRNEATGEVSVDIAGHTFTLKATFRNMAAFQAALAVPGMAMMQMLIEGVDPRAMHAGIQCLCTSGNADALDDILLTPHLATCKEAIMSAITAGLPDAPKDSKPGKKRGTTGKT